VGKPFALVEFYNYDTLDSPNLFHCIPAIVVLVNVGGAYLEQLHVYKGRPHIQIHIASAYFA